MVCNERFVVRLAAMKYAGCFAVNEHDKNSAKAQIIGHLFQK